MVEIQRIGLFWSGAKCTGGGGLSQEDHHKQGGVNFVQPISGNLFLTKGTHITGAEVSEQNVLDSTLRRNETDEQLIKKPIEMAHYQVTYMDNGQMSFELIYR